MRQVNTADGESRRFLTIYHRIFAGGTGSDRGVLVLNIDQSYMNELLDSLNGGWHTASCVSDASGNVLFSNSEYRARFAQNGTTPDELETAGLDADELTRLDVTIQKEKYVCLMQPLSVYGWRMIFLSPVESLYQAPNRGFQIMLLVLACVLGVVLSMAAYYDTNLRSGLENRANTTTDFFSNYIGQSYNEYYQSCIKFAKTFEDKDRLELQFISPGGKIVASSYGKFAGRSPSTPEIQQAIDSQQTRHYKGRNPLTGERILAVSSPMIYTNGEVIGVLRYVTSLRNADLQVLMIALIAVTVGLLFIGSIFFLSSFFIRSILVPVSQINATAKRIAAGSYGVQIPGQYDDEIGELVSTINDMSVKIGQAEKTQTEFISSVSHELRTPLTAISGWGETLLTSENLDAETRRGVVIIAREAKRLTGMVEELLEFTRMQDGRFTLHVETADILAEFEDTVFMYGNRLKQEGICLHYDGCEEDIPEIPCDVARMRQVFLNILDNAAKHGGEGKRIDASIAHEDRFVVIRIRDYGPGIPEEELPRVKLKFYKGSSKARGSGIGLAVCEEIVTMHGGTLTLENAEGGGTLVTICIPTGEE